ncbi:GNAT superfamily N-acetyltransferase [Paenibacillus phyllosphaerae]|uniref:GNAT superfamily N-acetyltransferase n=1 Tax=Paenibacillus phyllosphaerae TaxID=274593 RepID=A0A7W5B2M9_9BACL|nr:GNAT family N-acetyltransferase [Paenibacillus phyllosphaerae]MBB3112756.1 GNAT superfamily N-acetyltransferase [Paenibacillus phyllosphaerae]
MKLLLAKSDEEIRSTFPIMKQLRPHLSEEHYVSRIKHMQEQYGYQLLVLVDEAQVKACSGYKIGESLAWGKYLYVDDLITDQESRSRGYANQLFDWLETEAQRQECNGLHLDSGVQRHDAHRFYLKQKMKIAAYHFDKAYD